MVFILNQVNEKLKKNSTFFNPLKSVLTLKIVILDEVLI